MGSTNLNDLQKFVCGKNSESLLSRLYHLFVNKKIDCSVEFYHRIKRYNARSRDFKGLPFVINSILMLPWNHG